MERLEEIYHDPRTKRLITKYRHHYKEGLIWTMETGCLAFTGMMIWYLLILSSQRVGALDLIVILLFMLGALTYVGSSSLFSLSTDYWSSLLKKVNKWIFMCLSFIPGLYFAFQYETFILRFYLIVHIATTAYFFYKRYKEFELEPFVAGLGLSVVVGLISPSIRYFFGLFGSGWFVGTCQSFFCGLADLSLAVAFFFRLPEKYLPANMLCGLKVVKYLMFMFSWHTWYILMVITTWRNLGAGTTTIVEVYKNPDDLAEEESILNKPSTSKAGTSKTD